MKIGIFICLVLVSFNIKSNADTNIMQLNYDGFFDRMDDLDEPEYVDIKLAFYFNRLNSNVACPIRSAKLITKLKSMEVYYLEDGEVLLPFDEQLDMDKAKLLIETDRGLECGLNMRLENSFLLERTLPRDKLVALTQTFHDALKDLGGMMSYFVPDVSGVTLVVKPNAKLKLLNDANADCRDNICRISLKHLKSLDEELVFNQAPHKILPYIVH